MDFGLFAAFVSCEQAAVTFSARLLGTSVYSCVVHTPREGLLDPGCLQLSRYCQLRP